MRRGRILILLGLILAFGAAAGVFWLLQGATRTSTTPEIEREQVVIAVQPVAQGEVVDGRLGMQEVPSEGLTEGVLRSLDETTGKLAKIDLPQGQIISANMLQTLEEQMRSGALSSLIEDGYLAMAFPIDELSSVSYGIQPGDYVDVLMTLPFIEIDQENQVKEPLCPPLCPSGRLEGEQTQIQTTNQLQRLVTQLTLQKILVLGVGRWNYEPAPTEEETQTKNRGDAPAEVKVPGYITLMLQPQDALVIKLAREYGARIDLTVRAAGDGQDFATQAVTLDYLLARFGIELPPKQPYTIEALEVKATFVGQ